jgi:hypothetical protein
MHCYSQLLLQGASQTLHVCAMLRALLYCTCLQPSQCYTVKASSLKQQHCLCGYQHIASAVACRITLLLLLSITTCTRMLCLLLLSVTTASVCKHTLQAQQHCSPTATQLTTEPAASKSTPLSAASFLIALLVVTPAAAMRLPPLCTNSITVFTFSTSPDKLAAGANSTMLS